VGIWRNAQFSPAGAADSRSVRACCGPMGGRATGSRISKGSSCIAARPWRRRDRKVSSWNQAQETTVTGAGQAQHGEQKQRVGGAAQIYTFYPPNLNKEQADKWAAPRPKTLHGHERVITGRLPGDNLLTNRSLVKLVGTGTRLDQLYSVDSVTRKMGMAEGMRDGVSGQEPFDAEHGLTGVPSADRLRNHMRPGGSARHADISMPEGGDRDWQLRSGASSRAGSDPAGRDSDGLSADPLPW